MVVGGVERDRAVEEVDECFVVVVINDRRVSGFNDTKDFFVVL